MSDNLPHVGGKATVAKVGRYIAAPFRPFPLSLDIRGTDLQRRVWAEVRKIPFGETSTYSKIAAAIGAPKAIRAVAQSCSRSWFAFAVPCHRVLHTGAQARSRREGRQYAWVDYEAKLDRPPDLLDTEAKTPPQQNTQD